MYIFLESTTLSQKGFTSVIISHNVTFTFSSTVPLFNFEIKAKTSHLGGVYILPEGVEVINVAIKSGSLKENYTIRLNEGPGSIEMKTKKFSGILSYHIITGCVFTYFENLRLVADKKKCIEWHSKELVKPFKGITRRMSYNSYEYFADIYENVIHNSKESIPEESALPRGWERRFVNSGRAYYINHNKNYTQWHKPDDPGYINEIDGKVNDYRTKSAPINILGLFDFHKFKIPIIRRFMVQSTADLFLQSKKDAFVREPLVIYAGEIGEDWGALLKEFFYKASQEIINDERIKCIGCVYDVRTIEERKIEKLPHLGTHLNIDLETGTPLNTKRTPRFNAVEIQNMISDENISSKNINDVFEGILKDNPFFNERNFGMNCLPDKDFFTYLGIFVGFAFLNRVNISIDLSLAFYENLLKREFGIMHIQDVQVQEGINFILQCDPVKEGIYNDYTNEPLQYNEREKYAKDLILDILYLSKKNEYDWIKEGFSRVIDNSIVNFIETNDLIYLLGGSEEITFDMLLNSARFIKCNPTTKEIILLWEILKNSDEHYLRKFIQYVTGSASIPIGSIKTLRFKWFIEKSDTDNMLFKASTCVNRLYIGSYENVETMKRLLDYSIDNTEGFHKI